MPTKQAVVRIFLVLFAGQEACSSGKSGSATTQPPLPDAEVTTVTADPTQMKTLVQGWMQLPQYTQKMQRFFELAFQQTQVTATDFADQAYPRQIAVNATTTPLLVQNLQESFARTMLELIAEGQP